MVHPNHQKSGIGARLTEFRLREIARTPFVDIVVMDTSQHTVGFFERFGFSATSVEPDSYAAGLHRYNMQLALDPKRRERLIQAD